MCNGLIKNAVDPQVAAVAEMLQVPGQWQVEGHVVAGRGAAGPESSQSQEGTVHETTFQVSEGCWSCGSSRQETDG